MTTEQFTYWLKGYLEGATVLGHDHIATIKSKLETVYQPYYWGVNTGTITYPGTGYLTTTGATGSIGCHGLNY